MYKLRCSKESIILSILFMRFLEIKLDLTRIKDFQFSLWDSKDFPRVLSCIFYLLSILFMRFWRIVPETQRYPTPFNSLYEIHMLYNTKKREWKYELSILFMRFLVSFQKLLFLHKLLLSILFMRFQKTQVELRQKFIYFQFSLWDSDPFSSFLESKKLNLSFF